jgi:predicted MFS family arabinose efflux permease
MLLDIVLVFGGLCSNYFTDRFGRRLTFIVAAAGFIIGSLIQATATGYALLMVGRVFVGLGVGIGLAVSFTKRFFWLVWLIAVVRVICAVVGRCIRA